MDRLKWLARKYGWRVILGVVVVYMIIQLLPGLGGGATSKELSLSDLETKIEQQKVKEVSFDASEHELVVKLTDGTDAVVVYPMEYDDELTTMLLDKGVTIEAKNPGFFEENKGLFLLFGLILLTTVIPMAVMTIKSKFHARQKRVTNVPEQRFEHVLGAESQIEELAQLKDFIANPEKYRKAGVRVPRGWLFYGPPGTGKTLLARALAGEAGVPFFAYSGSDFAAMYVGEGASRVREMFKAARNAAYNQMVIILIDEIDAVGARRDSESGRSGSAVEILNQLLNELDGFLNDSPNIVVIGATNRKEVLDPALVRPGRLSRHLFFPEPPLPVRTAILEMYSSQLTYLSPEVNLEYLAKRTVGMSGAEIAEICNIAGLRALRDGDEVLVTTRHFELAIADHTIGRERRNTVLNAEDRNIAAIHEAGHALVALQTEKAPKPDEVTIVPRGTTGGSTWMTPEERDYLDVGRIKAHLQVAMGGRAAEKLLLAGDFSTGAAHDFENASTIARRAICEAGMGGLYDWVSTEYWETHPKADDIAEEVEAWLQEAEESAMRLLTEHRTIIDAVRNRLLEVETISGDDLRAIAEGTLLVSS